MPPDIVTLGLGPPVGDIDGDVAHAATANAASTSDATRGRDCE